MAELIETPLTVVHIISCAFLILVVLLQPGKSGGLGAFSGAAAQQVFGGRGAGNFLTKTTWIIASVFLVTSLSLAYLSSTSDDSLAKLAAVQVQDAAHANKAPEAAVKLGAESSSKPKADPEAIKRALESLTQGAGTVQPPVEAPGPVDAASKQDAPSGSDSSVALPKSTATSEVAKDGSSAPVEPSAPSTAPAPRRSTGAPRLPRSAPAVPQTQSGASPVQAPAAPAPAQPAAPAL